MQTLARHAEALFWLGRYIERSASLAGIIQVQTAFDRGRGTRDSWSWILTLYDEGEAFSKRYDTPTSRNVIRFYVSDKEHPASIASSFNFIKSNARAVRALISSDLWVHITRCHRRIKNLTESDLSEQRLSATCEQVQLDCYTLLGICHATFYRDAGWRFFELGVEIERADQMSRLLDVRYAQILSPPQNEQLGSQEFIHWSMLLRACAGHHAFRRLVSGPLESESIARFLMFEKRYVRSLAHSQLKISNAIDELDIYCDVPATQSLRWKSAAFYGLLKKKEMERKLVPGLHQFNDSIQRCLADLTGELGAAYFEPDMTFAGFESPIVIQNMMQSQS